MRATSISIVKYFVVCARAAPAGRVLASPPRPHLARPRLARPRLACSCTHPPHTLFEMRVNSGTGNIITSRDNNLGVKLLSAC